MAITKAPKAVELIATAVAAGTSAKDEDVFINAPLAPKIARFCNKPNDDILI